MVQRTPHQEAELKHLIIIPEPQDPQDAVTALANALEQRPWRRRTPKDEARRTYQRRGPRAWRKHDSRKLSDCVE